MKLPLEKLPREFGIKPGLVIHAGANLCQERFEYDKWGYGPIIWIEALESISNQARIVLNGFKNQYVLEAALWECSGIEIPFNVASNNAESSSIFTFKWHKALHPHVSTESRLILQSQILDDVIGSHFKDGVPPISLLVLDLQGAEYQALVGATKILELTQAIHIEVSTVELYAGQKLIYDIDAILTKVGFQLVAHDLTRKVCSGDALYLRNNLVGSTPCMPVPAKQKFPRISFKNIVKVILLRIGIPTHLIQSIIGRLRSRWRRLEGDQP
jgi:FkbM family methyltransferase